MHGSESLDDLSTMEQCEQWVVLYKEAHNSRKLDQPAPTNCPGEPHHPLINYKRFMADEIEFAPDWVDESRYNSSCSES